MSRSRSMPATSPLGVAPVALLMSLALGVASASGQAPARPADEPTPIAANRSGDKVNGGLATSSNVVRASARLEGTPSPGLRVTLDGSASSGGRVWYRWLQTQGPKVAMDDPTRPRTSFIVPTDVAMLGFVLIVGNASGVDAKAVTVDVEDPEREAADQALKADAGDDQTARVGRKVVLNGVRSEPRGKIRYRWVQAGGPKVTLRSGDSPSASFVPVAAGTYQFALVVATTSGLLSEASTVTITVAGAARAGADGTPMAIDELARVSLSSIDGGTRLAEDLSRAFDTVADGIDSFRTFAEAIAETTRRLDAVVPRDKERRAVWIERLFTPLMARFANGLKDDGLDVSQPGGPARPMTREQRARLAEQFRYAAAGLRASRTLR